MRKNFEVMHGLKPIIMMIFVQIMLAGGNVFYKLAGNNGISLRVLIAYRYMVAAATFLPLAAIIERHNMTKLTWKIVFQGFFIGLFGGSLGQNLYAESLVLTSAMFVAALSNLIPAITFTLAILLRMEKLQLDSRRGRAKVIGTATCIGGAMILTFYKGFEIKLWSNQIDLLHKTSGHVAPTHQNNHILGSFLAILCCFSISLSFILQGKMSEAYPWHYSSTTLISTMAALQALLISLVTERDWKQWKLGWDFKLLSIGYLGIVTSGIVTSLILYCSRAKGPFFVSIFNPLLLILIALTGSFLLRERLHLGSVIGAIIIICGLYSVLRGKGKKVRKIILPKVSKHDDIKNFENAI